MKDKGLSHSVPLRIHLLKCFPPPIPTSVSPALSALPHAQYPSNCISSLSLFTGRDDPPAFVQCGCRSALCPQRGQEHFVCHDTTLAGHLLPDAFHRLPARLRSLCSVPPQQTVGIILGPTVPRVSCSSLSLRKR